LARTLWDTVKDSEKAAVKGKVVKGGAVGATAAPDVPAATSRLTFPRSTRSYHFLYSSD
jgi:hypothetical protein